MRARLPGPRNPLEMLRLSAAMLRNPAPAMNELYRRHGSVVEFGVGRFRFVYLFGADANRYILSENPHNFRWREATASLIPVDGDTALVVSDGDEHRRRRRLVQPAFHTKRIQSYLDVMVEEADRELDQWAPGATVDAYERLKFVVRRIAVRSLFGDTLGDRADEIGRALVTAIAFFERPLPLQIKLNLPWTAWHRAKTGRDRADLIARDEIARRRALAAGADENGADLLAMLLAAQDEDASRLSDLEVRDQIVSLVAAGYETTSAAVGFAVAELLANPNAWHQAAAEVDAVVGNEPLSIGHLQAMPHLDAVVHETLRLWPPGYVSARKTVEPFEFQGHTIPNQPLLVWSPYVTQRDPSLWPDADRFLPDRWSGGEPEQFSYVPFGGAYRRCIGFAFAEQEIKAILVQLLRRARLRLASGGGRPQPTGNGTMRPAGGVPVVVEAVSTQN